VRLLYATHNAGKAEEARALLGARVEVVTAADMGLAVPEETGDTFHENARLKALAALRATGLPALADDSGVEVEALDGGPACIRPTGPRGRGAATSGGAMARVHDELRASGTPEPWRARFVAVLCLAAPGEPERFWEGVVEGRIVWPPRGPGGHGYDPAFQPEGHARTFAEMTLPEKNLLSHRARALHAFASDYLG
jgi:XTP/dITP diphosphohydrolase